MMNRIVGAIAIGMCIAATPAAAQQKPLTAAEVAQIKADVIKAGNDYLATYSKQDAEGVAKKSYSPVAVSIGQSGASAIDANKQMEGLKNTFKQRVSEGWVKSAFYNPTVCVVNANTALLSSKFRRYDKDGKQIFEAAEVLLYAKNPAGWQIVGLFGHAVDKVITCND